MPGQRGFASGASADAESEIERTCLRAGKAGQDFHAQEVLDKEASFETAGDSGLLRYRT